MPLYKPTAEMMSSDNFKAFLNSNHIYSANDIEWENKFSRFKILDNHNRLVGSKEFVFFTKPDLNLMANGRLTADAAKNSIIQAVYNRHPSMVKQLQSSSSTSGPFMNVLTNSLQNTADMPTLSAKSVQTSATAFGSSISYRKHSYESDESHDMTLEFEDTRYLELYSMFKVMDEYSNMRSVGTIKAKQTYIDTNTLDDQISIYKFIVAEDWYNILFYAKFTGCFAPNTPREVFSEIPEDGRLVYPINFKCTWVEDNDPIIIYEFNNLVSWSKRNADIPLYDTRRDLVNGKWVNSPYVLKRNNAYQLRWR